MLRLSRLFIGAVVATLVASALSTAALSSAFARGVNSNAAATAATSGDSLSQMTDQALRSRWKSEVSRLGFGDNVVSRVEKALVRQGVDRDSELFKELDALLKSADRLFGRAQAVVAAHMGFDASGNVTDRGQAIKSIQSLQADLHELRSKVILRLEQLIG